jgi:GGDEF domain-containing protein
MKTGSTVKRQSTGKEDPVYKMGKKRMKNEWTEQDLRQFVESSRPVFQDVSLTQVDEDADRCWQDDGLMVDYELRGGQVDCVLRRCVVADGKVWQLQMTAPLAGNDLPEDRMTPREREMCRDDMNHDFVTGVFNRRYYETEFCTKLDEWTDCHRCAALALVSIDGAEKLSARESDAVMGQLVCFVANQWKKHFDQPAERVVCRLSDTLFAIGCADRTRRELKEELKAIYAEMPKECVASVGLMRRVPFTQSIGVAGTREVRCKNWDALYDLCEKRLAAAQTAGGDRIYDGE